MKRLLLLLILLLNLNIIAQNLKQHVADKYYESLAYEKCAPMYAELANKEKATTDIIRKAADSYRLLNSPKDAEKWYTKLITKTDVIALDYYNYAQTLLLNGNYKEADVQMNKFYTLKAENSIGKRFVVAGNNYVSNLKKDSTKFTIKNLDMINSAESDFSPAYISKTELIYTTARENHGANNKQFAWDNTTFLDLYTTKIDSAKQTSSKAERFDKAFKTSYHDGPVSFSPDGKTMLLTRSNYFDDKLQKSSSNIINIQLYYATKIADKWSDLKPFPYNNKDYSLGHACFAPNGKIVYFVSDMPGTYGYTDIWETTYENNTFTQPKNMGQEVNTEGREMFPYVDEDNLLLFSSDGHLGLGGLDINMALVSNGVATYVGNIGYPVNTNHDDFGLIYDVKTLKGYFTSNRVGGKGKDDIYAVKFKEPLLGVKVLKAKVIDEATKDPLPYAIVKIIDENGLVLQELKADDKGDFQAIIPRGTAVKTIVSKDTYKPKTSDLVTYDNIPKEQTSIPLTKQDFRIDGLVVDAITNKPLDGVKISILDLVTNKDALLKLTDAKGDFKINLNDKKNEEKIKYQIHIEKEGYASKDITIEKTKTELLENSIIQLTEALNKSSEGMLSINPIFFDLDKSEIRPDAQTELDKLIETLKTCKDIKIEISSGTDCRATNSYNMNLSYRRAMATLNYLTAKGINKSRLKLKWTGETNLTTNCPCEPTNESACTEEQHQQNRRSNFKVTNFNIDAKASKTGI